MMNKKILALLLVVSGWLTAAAQGALPARIEDGAILHCWNWSYTNITSHLDRIAQQGFKAIQTSPIQPAKQNLRGSAVYDWWALYQPIDFKIADDNETAFGTKDEFRAMCEAAEAKGIKVIVDVVANHLANQNGNDLSPKIPDYLRNNAHFWHYSNGGFNTSNYSNRGDITWNTMGGLPDLNTENTELQGHVVRFLKECIDCGVDGFRFDAAKHINCPADDRYLNGAENSFWPNVIGQAKDYAQTKNQPLFIYGEILDNATAHEDRHKERAILDSYQTYMSITANVSSNNIRHAIEQRNTGSAAVGYIGLEGGATLSKAVLWAESHDTYANEHGESRNTPEDVILRTWALVGSRPSAPALYFARPASFDGNQKLGDASLTGWTRTEVAAVNRLKNETVGQGEYLSHHNDQQLVLNERGNRSAIIVAVGNNRNVSQLPAHRIGDGIYTDAVSQNSFRVENGLISGQIGESGVAVLRRTADLPAVTTSCTIHFNNESYGWDEGTGIWAYVYRDDNTSNAPWPGVRMKRNPVTGLYDYDVPEALANGRVIFSQRGDQTHRYPADGAAGLQIENQEKYFAARHSWTVRSNHYEGTQVFFDRQDDAGWDAPHIYLYAGSQNNSWRGPEMSFDAVTGYYFYNVPTPYANAKVIINKEGKGQLSDQQLAGKTVIIRKDNTMSAFTPPFFAPEGAQSIEVTYLAEGWSNVYAYVWNDNLVEPFGRWPGTPMTRIDDKHYSIAIPAGFEREKIIFHEGTDNPTRKTENITLEGRDQGYTALDGTRYHTAKIGSTGYATLYLDYHTVIPQGVTANTAKVVDNRVKLTAMDDQQLPKNTGAVIHSDVAGAYDFIEYRGEVATVSDNELLGSVVRTRPEEREAGQNYYLLVRRGEHAQFVRLLDGEGIPAYRAYLKMNANMGVQGFVLDDTTTAIDQLPTAATPEAAIFDLAGRRVKRPVSGGLYVKGGQKFVQP